MNKNNQLILEQNIRDILEKISDHTEKRMFGGICFMVNGHMACGVGKGKYMMRVSPDQYKQLLKENDAAEMDFTSRPMKGFIEFANDSNEERLLFWIQKVLDFVGALPPK